MQPARRLPSGRDYAKGGWGGPLSLVVDGGNRFEDLNVTASAIAAQLR